MNYLKNYIYNKMERKCQQCKQILNINNFIGEQKRCKVCSNLRKKKCKLCDKRPNFGFEDIGLALWCKEHSPRNTIDLMNKKCEEKGCDKRPSFGLEEDGIFRWCKKHSLPNAIIIGYRKCKKLGCKKQPSYGLKDDIKPFWCKEHCPLNSIDLVSKRCEEKGCDKRPSFGLEKDGVVRWCKKHALIGAINLISKRCEEKGCRKQPNFGLEEDGVVLWCKEHSPSNAVNLKDKKCVEIGCKKIPNFGLKEDGKVLWCKLHAPKNSIDLKNKKCEFQECKKNPCYGLEEDGIRKWCKEHSPINTVDLVNKKCKLCDKRPNFGLEENGLVLWCKEHSPSNAIDLKHKKCKKCNTRSSYGLIGNNPSRCAKHKEDGMFSNPKARCLKRDCKNLAQYGCSRRQIHCEEHKTENDILLSERECKNCGAIDILTEKGVCMTYCSADEKFKEYKKHEKKDEKRVLSLLEEQFGVPSSYDKMVINDCGYKERPDIVYDFIEHKVRIIIEIDENGDKHGSNCGELTTDENELNRMINIFNSFAEETHTIFIRYNPNTFYNNGIKNKITKKDRETLLVKWIQEIINNKPNIFLESPLAVLYLFYNEYSPSITTFKSINILKDKIYHCRRCFETVDYDKYPRMFLYYDKQEYRKHKETCH